MDIVSASGTSDVVCLATRRNVPEDTSYFECGTYFMKYISGSGVRYLLRD